MIFLILLINRHINTIKILKLENEDIRNKILEHEKLVDIFSYFFKKIKTYLPQERKNMKSSGEITSYENEK